MGCDRARERGQKLGDGFAADLTAPGRLRLSPEMEAMISFAIAFSQTKQAQFNPGRDPHRLQRDHD